MNNMGECLEKKYYAELPLKNIKSKIAKTRRDYIKEKEKRHSQSETDELATRIDTLDQVLKLFPK